MVKVFFDPVRIRNYLGRWVIRYF